MKIAIVDSGVNEKALNKKISSQYRIYNGTIYKESPIDYVGHGTAIASILSKECEFELISICPGINNMGIPDRIISLEDIYTSIKLCIELNVDIINISMGTTVLSNRRKMDEICESCKRKGILIFCAESPEGYVTLPWACKGVIRVRAIEGNTYSVSVCENSKIPTVEIVGSIYRIVTREGRNFFASGNSYATPFFITFIYKFINNNKLGISFSDAINVYFKKNNDNMFRYLTETQVMHVHDNLEYIYNNTSKLGKVIIVPFSKEMHVLVRNSAKLGGEIVGVIDPIKNANIDKDPGNLLNIEPLNIKITNSLDKIQKEANKLIIGYTNEIQKYDPYFSLDNLLEENLKHLKLDVFSFIPPDIQWIEVYRKEGIKLEFPTLINHENYFKLLKAVTRKVSIYKPVIAVFGTSSSQGKVTLQMNIKNAFEKRGLHPFYISTENHGSLLGAGFTFASGYGNDKIISLDTDKCINFLNHVMSYVDDLPTYDLFLVGNQSWLIPYNKEQTFMRSATLLEGIKPDLAVLVVNPLIDPYDYIQDTISALKSIYKCQVIALAFSDNTPSYNSYGKICKKKLCDLEIKEQIEKLTESFGIPTGFIGNEEFIDSIINKIIELCEY